MPAKGFNWRPTGVDFFSGYKPPAQVPTAAVISWCIDEYTDFVTQPVIQVNSWQKVRMVKIEWASALFMGLITLMGRLTGADMLVFPELGALSHDIIKRPNGTWANAPLMLVLTPLSTAAAGVLITRHMHFGVLAQLLNLVASLLVIGVTRSPVAPAISAGLLPLVLGIHSWWYPPSITIGTGLLATLSMIQRRLYPRHSTVTARDIVDDVVEKAPSSLGWLPPFLLVVTALCGWPNGAGCASSCFRPW